MDGLEGGDAIQRHLDRPEKWDHESHIQFNKARCKCTNIQFVCLYQTIFAQKKGQEVSPRGHISDNSVYFSPWAIRKILLDGKWTPVLGVDVGIFLSMAKLCCLNFFTINLLIWCENGCLPPGFFLPPAIGSSHTLTSPFWQWGVSWSQVLPHCSVHSASCKVYLWPALLDFKPVKVQALASLKTCWGNPGLSLKQTWVHTHMCTDSLAHILFFWRDHCVPLYLLLPHTHPF